jgi:signal peptidase I
MAPTLQCSRAGNDWVLTDMLSGYFHSPQRWDVVDFTNADGVRVMKRVIALPGETIRIWKGVLYINGQPMARPDTFPPFDYLPYGNLQGGATQDCGAGYYVLGDDTADSQDSRFEGPIAPSRLRARALLIVWPYSRIGWVK